MIKELRKVESWEAVFIHSLTNSSSEKKKKYINNRVDCSIHNRTSVFKMGFVEVFSLLAATMVGCIYVIYHEDMQWDILSVDLLGHSHLTFLSPMTLACIRLFFASTVWLSIAFLVFDRTGLTLTVLTRDGSKRTLLLKHFERLTMFTVWSWILQVSPLIH